MVTIFDNPFGLKGFKWNSEMQVLLECLTMFETLCSIVNQEFFNLLFLDLKWLLKQNYCKYSFIQVNSYI